MIELREKNTNARLALDMLPRVLTTRKVSSEMADSNIPQRPRSGKPGMPQRPIIDGKLRCSKCKEFKPATLEYFGAHKSSPIGFQSWCKACKKAAPKKPYVSTPERLAKKREVSKRPEEKERARKYRQEHYQTDEYREKRRLEQQQPEKKAKRKEYYSRPEVKARQRVRGREYGKKYRQTQKYKDTRKKINERRKTDAAFKAQMKVAYQKRQARKLELPDTLTVEQWNYALEYFNGCCAVCGRPLKDLFGTHTVSIDHWIPLTNPECPGTTADNCIPLCHGFDGCNGSKNDREPLEWLVTKFGKRKGNQILKRIEAYFETLKSDGLEKAA